MSDVPITYGTGQASIAGETVGGRTFQIVEINGGGGSSVLSVNPDGSFKASIIGTPTFIGVQQGSVAAVIIGGSITATVSAVANQSVSGTVQTDVRGSVATVIIGGSVTASFTPPANQSVSGEVSVSNFPTTQNVSGSVVASGTVDIGNTVTVAQATAANLKAAVSVVGTVPVTQTTSPWIVTGSVQGSFTPSGNQSVSGTVGASIIGMPNPLVITGSVQGTFSPSGNQSVSGTVQTDVRGSVAAVIIGGSIAASFTPPANQSVSGAVTAPAGSILAVSGTFFPSNQSVSGTVGASIIGAVPVTGFPTTQNISGSVAAWLNSSNASVVTTIASITTAEGFIRTVPPVGATVQGIADLQVVQGASVTAIAAQGTSVFTYITGVQVTNFGSASVLVRLGGGLGSTLGWTIAPAGGGSNVVYPTGLRTGANSAFTASISGVASVIVSAQGFTAKT